MAGLQLIARKDNNSTAFITPEAFIRTERDDILYGTFRAAMKNVHAAGIFATFNWRGNDAVTGDRNRMVGFMFPASNGTVTTLFSGSPESVDTCHPNASTIFEDADFHVVAGDDTRMHEYRFDWLPDRIDYYMDGYFTSSSPNSFPTSPGSIEISVWASRDDNHNPVISEDTVVTVEYTKFYFNTTSDNSISDRWAQGKCQGWDLGGRVEPIPTQFWDEHTGETFFFSNPKTQKEETLEHTDMQLSTDAANMKTISVALTLAIVIFTSFMVMLTH